MTEKQPVIMQIIPELSAGGAEQGCIDVGAEIARSGAKSIIVSNGGNRIHELQRLNIEHINLPVHSKNPLTILNNIRRIKKYIKKHNVDIVHVRSRAPAWSALKACEKTNTHYMSTCHAPYNISGDLKRKYNSAIVQGERVIAISNYVSEYMQREYQTSPENIRLIHRGINLERFHPSKVTPHRMIDVSKSWRVPDGSNIILLPGRLTRWKGHHVLIEAMGQLKRNDLFCVIIGDDQGRMHYRKELEQTIKQNGLEDRVRIVRHCNDMPAAYMLSSIVVSASTDPEGFGRIPVEAQAMGRPIIATNHGGAQETVVHNETGWLTDPGNAEELAHAIHHIMNLSQEQRNLLATKAIDHVAQNFTTEIMVDKTMDVYAEILRENVHNAIKSEQDIAA